MTAQQAGIERVRDAQEFGTWVDGGEIRAPLAARPLRWLREKPAGERDLKALLAAYPSDGKSVADVLETFLVTQRAPGSVGGAPAEWSARAYRNLVGARATIRDARAINDKVRLLAKLGAALIEARETGADLQEAIASAIGWDKLARSFEEAKHLVRPDKVDLADLAARVWPVLHRLGPLFLDRSAFTPFRPPSLRCGIETGRIHVDKGYRGHNH